MLSFQQPVIDLVLTTQKCCYLITMLVSAHKSDDWGKVSSKQKFKIWIEKNKMKLLQQLPLISLNAVP